MPNFHSKEVRQLLHNKFVAILGDSIQRSVYKDLIRLLQKDSLLSSSQMKSKGELCFENDRLIEGGILGELHNGTHYREVRQYRTHHHLIRFYFLTRVYSEYLESILDDFREGPKPDVLVLNSCIWDLSRYGSYCMKEYCQNLQTVFNRLDAVLPPTCLVLWNMTMPLGPKVTGGFLIPELQHLSQSLRNDVIEGNFYGATLAGLHLFDVLDLHFHFRHDLGNRVKDGVHWNNVVHRRITNLLLAHVADAWGVVIPATKSQEGQMCSEPSPFLDVQLGPVPPRPPAMSLHRPPWPTVHEDSFFGLNSWESCETYSGVPFFEDSHFPSFHRDGWICNEPSPCSDLLGPVPPCPPPMSLPRPHWPAVHEDSLFELDSRGLAETCSGVPFFVDSCAPPFHLDAPALNAFQDFGSAAAAIPDPSLLPPYPFCNKENIGPRASRRKRRPHRSKKNRGLVMRRRSFRRDDATPY
ncbi:PC-esterase domain-containing protein 1A-like [Heteronotia binoei]|uniref:PC-esterase domain-containing protein 1A-like n=1 Tax=Heteronotia binoei TaxID=13085 RepID=UPI002930F076|nr:PC-esterase domain-containing protein 1A-like [Heteronotia binoei]